jgi:tRNA 2-thiouridine synthesizing protein B
MLHIVNKSHQQTSALASCLRLAQDGAALLLTEDAVYAATRAGAASSGIAAARARLKVYALAPDLAAGGGGAPVGEGHTRGEY